MFRYKAIYSLFSLRPRCNLSMKIGNFQRTRHYLSFFSATATKFFSSTSQPTVFEKVDNVWTWELFYNGPSIGILINWICQKPAVSCDIFGIPSQFFQKTMTSFLVSRTQSNSKHFSSKIRLKNFYFDPCIRMLMVGHFQKMLNSFVSFSIFELLYHHK